MLKRPFITRSFTLLAGDSRTTRVSLVIRVLDDVTGAVVAERTKVLLKGKKDLVPILNLSGYFCFTDLDPGTYTVEVKSDIFAADGYFDQERDVILPENPLDEWYLNPVEEFRLTPRPSFPLPTHATLVRGLVREKSEPAEDGKRIVDAEVEAGYVDAESIIKTRTDHDGEFVLIIKAKNIELEPDKKTLKNIRIDIKKDNKTMSLTVNEKLTELNEPLLKEGKTARLGIIDFLAN